MGSAELRDALAAHWRLFRADGKPLMPVLPATPATPAKGARWLPRVREMWQRIWTGPQALEWLPPMLPVIERYAEMSQRFYAGEGDALRVDTALRALEDSLGLTPRAYRSLQWEVEKGEEAEEKVARRRQQRQTPAVTGQDVRDVLRDVSQPVAAPAPAKSSRRRAKVVEEAAAPAVEEVKPVVERRVKSGERRAKTGAPMAPATKRRAPRKASAKGGE